MGNFESAVWGDLVPLVQATWPEITAIFRHDLVDRDSIRSLLNRSELELPCALIGLESSKAEDWGIDNEAYRLQVTISYWLRRDDSRAIVPGGFDLDGLLLTLLQALRDGLIAHNGAFQCAGEWPVISLGDVGSESEIFRKEKLPISAGILRFGALVGQSFGP